ncbi:NAD-dependent epimerase/dehydratase family protein, partial [Kitasatospora sp. NPDC093102]
MAGVVDLAVESGVVLVVGGTGKTGRRVADRLAARGYEVRVGSRSGAVPFDWHDEGTWEGALEGVSAAYLTYYPDLAFPGAVEA